MSNKKRTVKSAADDAVILAFSGVRAAGTQRIRALVRPLVGGALAVAALAGRPAHAGDDDAARAALQTAQQLVGEWRGVGQPKRGATAGAWVERASAGWDFSAERPRLTMAIEDGKHLRSAELHPPGRPDRPFTLRATLADGRSLEFAGQADAAGAWTFTAPEPLAEQPARISWKFVAEGARLVMLLEARAPGAERYYRLAEVGYTRQGARFAAADGNPECVVTGGYGSVTVEHRGMTYYVCCGGCRELFESDPERVLADYRARQAEKRKP